MKLLSELVSKLSERIRLSVSLCALRPLVSRVPCIYIPNYNNLCPILPGSPHAHTHLWPRRVGQLRHRVALRSQTGMTADGDGRKRNATASGSDAAFGRRTLLEG